MSAVDKTKYGLRNILTLINEIGLFIFFAYFNCNYKFKIVFNVIFYCNNSYYYFRPNFKKNNYENGAAAFHYEAVALKNLMQSISMIKEIKIFGKIRYFLDYFSTS